MVDKRYSVLAVASPALRTMLIALCMMLLVAGCGSWFRKTIKVEVGAVNEVRSVGRVVAATTEDPMYEDTIQIDDVLLMDVGAASFELGMDHARKLLEQRGWTSTDERVDYVRMESTRWKDTSLTMQTYRKGDSYADSVQTRIEGNVYVKPADRNKYVLVVITRSYP